MSIPITVKDNKREYLQGINAERRSNPISIQKVRERLLNKRVTDAIIEESLGSEVTEDKRERIVRMIEGIS
jgi:SOS response regulatory protein OraA/RecX